jgi:putative oxidoreductase
MALSFLGKYKDFGLFMLRLGIGLGFMLVYGWPKISAGPEFWLKLGGSMGNLGIHFAPTAWGFMSALTEFGGGLLLTLGLFTRPVAFFMAFNMIVAITQHFHSLDPWNKVIYPIEMLAVFIGIMFVGAGKLSLDNLFFKKV